MQASYELLWHPRRSVSLVGRSLLALGLVAVLLNIVAPVAPARSSAASCPPYRLIDTHGIDTDDGVFSTAGWAFDEAFSSILDGVYIERDVNPYHSYQLGDELLSANWSTSFYVQSVATGVTFLHAMIEQTTRECGSKTKIILTGHSEGAQVTADAYQDKTLSAAVRANIVGVALFADPRFNHKDRSSLNTDFQKANGALPLDGLTEIFRNIGVRKAFNSPAVLEYCHSDDPICQDIAGRKNGGLDPRHFNWVKFGSYWATGTHSAYASRGDAGDAGTYLARLALQADRAPSSGDFSFAGACLADGTTVIDPSTESIPFSDPDGDSLTGIVVGQPAAGTGILQSYQLVGGVLQRVPVPAGTFVSLVNLEGDVLTFQWADGISQTTIPFQVQDTYGARSTNHTLTVTRTTECGPPPPPPPPSGGGTQSWVSRYDSGTSDYAAALAISPDGSKVFVTGSSECVFPIVGSGCSDFGYRATSVAYAASTGAQLWVARYDGGSTGDAYDVAVSPDGSKVFITGDSGLDYATVAYAASTGSQLWVTHYDTGAAIRATARALAVSPDGSKVFVTGESYNGSTYDYATVAYTASEGAQAWVARYDGGSLDEARAVSVSPDDSKVVVTGLSLSGTTYGTATVAYDATTGAQAWAVRSDALYGVPMRQHSLAMSPDGSKLFVTGESLLSATGDYLTMAYDAATGTQAWAATYDAGGNQDYSQAVAVSPDGSKVFVTGSSFSSSSYYDYATVAYAASTGAQAWVARYDGGFFCERANALAVSPDGAKVFVTGGSGDCSSFDYATVAYQAG